MRAISTFALKENIIETSEKNRHSTIPIFSLSFTISLSLFICLYILYFRMCTHTHALTHSHALAHILTLAIVANSFYVCQIEAFFAPFDTRKYLEFKRLHLSTQGWHQILNNSYLIYCLLRQNEVLMLPSCMSG